jgi:hypothetical protein
MGLPGDAGGMRVRSKKPAEKGLDSSAVGEELTPVLALQSPV